MKETERISCGFGLTIDFLKDDSLKGHTGLFFFEAGLVGILEASDYSSIDQVSFSLELLQTRFTGLVTVWKMPRVSTCFVDLLHLINRYDKDPEWAVERSFSISVSDSCFQDNSANHLCKNPSIWDGSLKAGPPRSY